MCSFDKDMEHYCVKIRSMRNSIKHSGMQGGDILYEPACMLVHMLPVNHFHSK